MGKGKNKALDDIEVPAPSTTDTLQIKYVRIDRGDNSAPPLERLGSGYVLRNTKFAKLPPHRSALAHTGIQMKIPAGYQGRITGLNKHGYKNLITVAGGIINSNYTGEIKVIMLNHSDIKRDLIEGNTVGILHLEKVPDVELVEVSSLKASLGKISGELAELDSLM